MTDLDTLESTLNCSSIEELHAATRKLVNQLGYEHFIYGVQVNTSLTRPYQFVFSGYPTEGDRACLSLYQSAKFQRTFTSAHCGLPSDRER